MSEYIEVGQPLQFTDPNTPTRVGEIVENVSDIYNIPSPRLGMQVFVKNEKKSFVITSLKSKTIGGVDVPEAAVEAFEPVGAKSFTWNNDTDPSNMNDFVVAGVYDIKGEHTREDDNLPILNTGGRHTFNARLTVLDSSITGSGNSDDKCITQVLSFCNRLGQGEVYIRTGKGSSLDSLTWEKWSALQRNVNVGQVDNLDNLKDNGIYSGVWTKGSYNAYPLTFVCIVINDYFVGVAPRRISQFVYGLSKFDGSTVYQSRVWDDSKNAWSDWEILNQKKISSMISAEIKKVTDGIDPNKIDSLKDIITWIEEHGGDVTAIYNAIQGNTIKINAEVNRAQAVEAGLGEYISHVEGEVSTINADIAETKKNIASSLHASSVADSVNITGKSDVGRTIFSAEIPAATTENAGVMSAGDKQMLYQSFVKSVGEFQSRNYDGIYCANVNTGNVANANSTSNGIVIQVKEGEVYKIIGDNLKYNASSVQFYNGYPSLDTNISNVYIRNDQVKVPQGAVYMLVSVNPSKGTETTIKQLNWITMEDSALLSDAIENIGSDYKTQIINVTQGVAAGSNTVFPISLLNEGDIIQCYVDSDIDVSMSLVTFNGRVILAIKTNQVFTKEITADDITGNTFGFYINKGQAVESGTLNCALRIIKKDASPITLSRYALKSQEISNEIESLSNTLDEVIEIPNNNNYIKNWEIGNKLVVRLYVENRDKALEDKLYIRQIFKLSETNYGFNFGTKNSESDITIAPNIGPFEVYEITRYFSQGVRGSKYGKIAIRMDWNAIDWGTSTVQAISSQTESNLNDICFDWNEFEKPLQPIFNITDSSITESKLSEEVKEKLNSSVPLQRYELFSLGDSLSAGGVWQTKVAELTGCIFDQSKNVKAGAMLSVGGTSSSGTTFDNVLWRAKNLIDQGYITDEGENAIVILENVNDGYVAFDENVKSVIPTTPIEGYNNSDFSSSFLESINDKAQLNAVLRLNTVIAGRNLRIDNLPTKAGNITLRIGWSGPGISNYNVFVEPQATNEETLAHVLDKILEYAYTGITDVLGEDGRSVDFSSGNSNYLPTVQFTDTDNTGMTVTITDNPNAKGSVARYFIGENISEWTDTTKWQKGISYSQGWKSAIEMLQRAYPKLHIFVSMFPLHSVTASDYLLPNGSYDTVAYNSVSRMEMMRKMQVELAKIAEFYSVPFINVFAECGIGINNMLTYYNASANVHPKNEGYYRFGETIAAQLKRFLA